MVKTETYIHKITNERKKIRNNVWIRKKKEEEEMTEIHKMKDHEWKNYYNKFL